MQRAKKILGAIVLLTTLFMLSKAQAQSLGPNGHFYKLVLEPGLLWEEARIKAAESTLNGVHGYLATIGSLEEDQFIESLWLPNSNSIVWLGGSQATNAASSKSGWVWVNGEGLIPGDNGGDVYAHWMLGEPDDFAGPNTEQFLAMGQYGLSGWSSEADDRHVNGYVVEYPSGGVASEVSVVTIDPVAVEGDGTEDSINIATFEFRRAGDTSLDLPVFYSVGGTARNGGDYEEIPKSIIIPAGEASVQLNIIPISDFLAGGEPMETVGIRIDPSLILTPEAAYTIDADRREAAAVIYDLAPPVNGGLQIAVPPNSTTYQPSESVVALAALSFSNVVEKVDFWYTTLSPFASNKIASVSAYSRTNELAFYRLNWTNPISGKGAITALAYPATSSNRLASLPFSITVQGDTNPPVVSIRTITPPASTNMYVAADFAPSYFEVSRDGSTFGNLQVFYSIGGSATAGADYDPIANYVVIGNGKSAAKIIINAIDDSLPELTEFVTLSLIAPTNGIPSYTVNSAMSQASVAIYDNDPIPTNTIVSLEVSSPDAVEPLPWAVGSGEFIVRRVGETSFDLPVRVNLSGTATFGADYGTYLLNSNNTVVIPAGSSFSQFLIVPVADSIIEPDETVVAELASAPAGGVPYGIDASHRRGVVTIHDRTAEMPTNSIVAVGATVRDTWEPGGTNTAAGEFIFLRGSPTNQAIRVSFDISGTASNGVDYATLPGFIDFAPGQTVAYLTVHPLTDDLVEGNETVDLQLKSSDAYTIDPLNPNAFVRIHDTTSTVTNPPTTTNVIVSLELVSPDASEPNTNGITTSVALIAHRTGPTNTALAVNIAYSGTATFGVDYLATNRVVIPPGGTFAYFSVVPLGDNLVEGDETVNVRIAASTNSPGYLIDTNHYTATVSIHDNTPVPPSTNVIVSLELVSPDASEPNTNGITTSVALIAHRTGPTNTGLAVNIAYTGTATFGVDYLATNRVVIPPGGTFAYFSVVPLGDNLVEGDETVNVQIAASTNSPGYLIDTNHYTGTILIHDSNPTSSNAVVSLTAISTETSEPNTNGITTAVALLLRRTGPTNSALTVYLGYSGSATYGQDYSASNSVVFPPGSSERLFNVTPLADNLVEGDETVIAELLLIPGSALPHYDADPDHHRVTVTIHDATVPPPATIVSVEAAQPETWEPYPEGIPASFTISRSGSLSNSLSVYMFLGGTATYGVDYSASTNIIDFLPGQSEVVRYITPLADNLVESDETVFMQLVGHGTDYTVNTNRQRATVTIHDRDSLPTVSVEATKPDAYEPSIPGEFTLRRTGPTNTSITVFFGLGGTAKYGIDYSANTNSAVFLAGQSVVVRQVIPIPDNITETNETVVLQIIGRGTIYNTDLDKQSATVTIHEATTNENRAPIATIVKPSVGAVFTVGDSIEIVAEGSDSDGSIKKMELLADNVSLGSANTNRIVFHWTNAPVGQHILVARATDNKDKVGLSTNVTILIRAKNAGAFVFRNLPDAYTPGVAFRVELRAEPPATTHAYAIEDRPPQGWQVTAISNDGYFDATNGKVKFGPFADTLTRTLAYTVTPPPSANGRREFAGNGSIDGVSYAIGGDETIEQGSQYHPADVDSNFRIVLDEVTAYASAWKTSTNNTNAIPLSFVTRAGYLWKHGETYRFNASAGDPPLCWIPLTAPAGPAVAAPGGAAVRVGAELLQPGVSAEMQISLSPAAGTAAYAVEEQIPNGWTVKNINEGGVFDANSSTIRWGVFFDGANRTLRYTVTPPANIAEIGRLRGTVSFDGMKAEITGRDRVVSFEDGKRPTLGNCERVAGGVRVTLGGEAGQVGILQRSSDLENWQDVTTIFLPDGTADYIDATETGGNYFYRLQVR